MERVVRQRAFTRRAALAGGFAAMTAVPGLVAAPEARAEPAERGRGRYTERAEASYAALQRYFYDPATSFYLEEYPRTGDNPWSYVWPFSQALLATQALTGIPEVGRHYRANLADRYTALEAYWNSTTTPPGYDSYLRPPLGQGGDKPRDYPKLT